MGGGSAVRSRCNFFLGGGVGGGVAGSRRRCWERGGCRRFLLIFFEGGGTEWEDAWGTGTWGAAGTVDGRQTDANKHA